MNEDSMGAHAETIVRSTTSQAMQQTFWTVVIIPLVFYLAAFGLTHMPHYERWCRPFWGPILDYNYTPNIRGVDADVVIFGDSSALFGVDTVALSRSSGLKVFNLPNTAGSLAVTREMPLQRYLKYNKAPRLIVLYLAPWDLDYMLTLHNSKMYEGEDLLMRHGTTAEIAAFARRNPGEFLKFPFHFYSVNTVFRIGSTLLHDNPSPPISENLGHVANPTLKPLAPGCRMPASLSLQDVTPASTIQFRQRYTTEETKVAVYVASIPDCIGADALLQADFHAFGAEPPAILAAGNFADDGSLLHIASASVPTETQHFLTVIGPAFLSSAVSH